MNRLPPKIFAQWKEALSLLRAIKSASSTVDRSKKILHAKSYLAKSDDEHLKRLSQLMDADMDEARLLCVLVPIERVASRDRVTDAEMLQDIEESVSTEDDETHIKKEKNRCIVVLDNLRSAVNIGGIIRTAEFFGLEEVWMCGYTATPENAQVLKSSLGSETFIKWRYFESTQEAIDLLKEKAYQVLALETSSRAKDINAYNFTKPCALILGNERFGVSTNLLAQADDLLIIPGYGVKNSLNVVCAFAIACNKLVN